MLRWYVIQSEPCQEARAAMSIAECGFHAFLPLQEREATKARRGEPARPLFPGYLFAEFDIADVWQPLLRSRGIQTILGINRVSIAVPTPIPVPEGFVEQLSEFLISKGGKLPLPKAEPLPRLSTGARVSITEGAFAGMDAIVDADEGDRVRLLLDILGGLVPTIVLRESVHAKC